MINEHGTHEMPARNRAPLVGIMIGAAIGAGVALLMAPSSGSETRRRIGVTSRRLGSRLRSGVDHARDRVSGLKHDVGAAVASSRESYVRERDSRVVSADTPRSL